MKKIVVLFVLSVFLACNGSAQKNSIAQNKKYEVTKSDDQWKAELTELQYYVMRKQGTEPAFTSELNKNYSKGVYVCAACGTPLFESDYKFDSGTGWPSFDREIKGNVAFSSTDNPYFGTEEHCAVCGGHLGHRFNDGPRNTTGQRHCINGAALKFVAENE